MTVGELPLAGMTVVALEQAVAGPLASRHLADLGARVVKIERPDGGDFARGYDDVVRGIASHFVWLNRGKESLVLDLKSAAGARAARALIARADVFLHNTAPGVVERLGLDAETLRADQPELVVVNISGYGRTGPRRDRKAYDMLIQAESGMVAVTGTPQTATKTGVPTVDIGAGVYAAMSVLGALVRRARTGVGAVIDVSMFDAAVEWMGHPLYMQLYGGRQVPRMGLSHAAIAPYDAYPTADGQILIGVQNDRGWRALVGAVFGKPEYADDPRFATNVARVANRAECDMLVADFTRQWATADLDQALADAGVPAGQLNGTAEVVEHPQLSARDRWRSVRTEVGEVRGVLPRMTFRDVELPMGPVPALGEHTRAVLAELGIHDDAPSEFRPEEIADV